MKVINSLSKPKEATTLLRNHWWGSVAIEVAAFVLRVPNALYYLNLFNAVQLFCFSARAGERSTSEGARFEILLSELTHGHPICCCWQIHKNNKWPSKWSSPCRCRLGEDRDGFSYSCVIKHTILGYRAADRAKTKRLVLEQPELLTPRDYKHWPHYLT